MQGRKNKRLGTKRIEQLKEYGNYIRADLSEYNKKDIPSIKIAFHMAARRRNFNVACVLVNEGKVLMIIRK